MDMSEFSKINRERCEASNGFNCPLNSWTLNDWFTATLGELGEAANIAKKLKRAEDGIIGNKQSTAELRAKLASELADTFIYLDLLAQSQGINLSSAIQQTFSAKSIEIGYNV